MYRRLLWVFVAGSFGISVLALLPDTPYATWSRVEQAVRAQARRAGRPYGDPVPARATVERVTTSGEVRERVLGATAAGLFGLS